VDQGPQLRIPFPPTRAGALGAAEILVVLVDDVSRICDAELIGGSHVMNLPRPSFDRARVVAFDVVEPLALSVLPRNLGIVLTPYRQKAVVSFNLSEL
jgi:hypothetical protein